MKRRTFIQSALASIATMPLLLSANENNVSSESNASVENNSTAQSEVKLPKSKNDMSFEEALKVITEGKEVKDSDKITLSVPEIAENGAVVPVKVEVDYPMEEKNHVKAIHILNTKNGNARCADIMLSPANDKAYFATRIKLSETQEVVALVALSDGTFMKAGKSIKVTIGGCG